MTMSKKDLIKVLKKIDKSNNQRHNTSISKESNKKRSITINEMIYKEKNKGV